MKKVSMDTFTIFTKHLLIFKIRIPDKIQISNDSILVSVIIHKKLEKKIKKLNVDLSQHFKNSHLEFFW